MKKLNAIAKYFSIGEILLWSLSVILIVSAVGEFFNFRKNSNFLPPFLSWRIDLLVIR